MRGRNPKTPAGVNLRWLMLAVAVAILPAMLPAQTTTIGASSVPAPTTVLANQASRAGLRPSGPMGSPELHRMHANSQTEPAGRVLSRTGSPPGPRSLGLGDLFQRNWLEAYYFGSGEVNFPRDATTDAAGNVYVTGTTNLFGSGDYATIKYGPDGSLKWTATYDNGGDDYGHAIAVDADGNVYVIGESQGSGTDYDFLTIKYSPTGAEVWEARFDSAGKYDAGAAIALDVTGNVYVTGTTTKSSGALDYTTIKYAPDGGEPLWVNSTPGPSPYGAWAFPWAMAVDASGDVYVTGRIASSSQNLGQTIKCSGSDGHTLWQKTAGEAFWALALDGSGNPIVTGYNSSIEYLTVKYACSDGSELHSATFANGEGYGVAVDAQDNVYVTGFAYSGWGRCGTIKYDADLVQQWVALSDFGVDDEARDIALDASGNVWVTGHTVDHHSTGGALTIAYDAATGSRLWHDIYYGGAEAYAIAADPFGNVDVAGFANDPVLFLFADYLTIQYGPLQAAQGWSTRAAFPGLPPTEEEGPGGWLAYNPHDGLMYAARGANTADFYAYDRNSDRWTPLNPIPAGLEGKLPEKGCKGVADGAYTIYMTKGNNTLGFWCYYTFDGTWYQLPDVPVAKDSVRDGVALACVNIGWDDIYLLRGPGGEFCRYNTSEEYWEVLPTAPSKTSDGGWGDGSWLAYDGSKWLYAHQGGSQDMYRFDIAGDSWDPNVIGGMPLESGFDGNGKKKTPLGPGGCATWLAGAIYALKGNKTTQFWSYLPGSGWTELDPMPQVGTSGKKHSVGQGGDITSDGYIIFAFKGNRSNELWRYRMPAPVIGSGGTQLAWVGPMGSLTGMELSPNPAHAGVVTVHYALPAGGPMKVTLFDISGRAVQTQSCRAVGSSGSLALDLGRLSAGIYVARLQSGDLSLSEKLVIER